MKTFFTLCLLLVNATVWAECGSTSVAISVLGSGGPELNDQRRSSGYIVWVDGSARLIVDAGAGTSIAFGEAGGQFEDLQGILLTHLHVDHSADIPAFIKGSFFTPRNQDLPIIGPSKNAIMPSTEAFIDRLISAQGAFSYLQSFHRDSASDDYKVLPISVPVSTEPFKHSFGNTLKASAVAVHHGPIAALAWKVEAEGCSIVFSGDMSNEKQVLAKFAQGADLLIANNAVPKGAHGVATNLHMLPEEIGQIAKESAPKKLMLSHFMSRSNSVQDETMSIIKRHYQGAVILAEDGMKINL